MYKGADITNWYQSLDPEVRNAAIRGLIGSALGAGTLGGVSAAISTDGHKTRRVVNNALMGALLGGVGAAGVPAGLNMIRGKTRFPGEHNKPLIGRGIDMVGQPFTTHPATTAGMLGGGYVAHKGYPQIREALEPLVKGIKEEDAAKQRMGFKVVPKGLSESAVAGRASTLSQKMRALARLMRSPHAGLEHGDKAQILLNAIRNPQAHEALAKNISALDELKIRGTRGLYALPIGLGAGWLLDRYLKGNY